MCVGQVNTVSTGTVVG